MFVSLSVSIPTRRGTNGTTEAIQRVVKDSKIDRGSAWF